MKRKVAIVALISTVLSVGVAAPAWASAGSAAAAKPAAPTNLLIDSPEQGCVGLPAFVQLEEGSQFILRADVDAAFGVQTGTFQVTAPDETTVFATLTSPSTIKTAQVTLPGSVIASTAGFAWRARSSDGVVSSPWSRWCHVTIDNTVPGQPTLSSTQIASGHVREGVPITFNISGGGPAAYAYEWTTDGNAFTVDNPVPCATSQSYVCATAAGDARLRIIPDQFTSSICVRAITRRTLAVSPETCLEYQTVEQVITPSHRWATSGAPQTASVADSGTMGGAPLSLTGATWTATGPTSGSVGPALTFTGSAASASSDSTVLDPASAFSIGFWAEFTSIPAQPATVVVAGPFSVQTTGAGTVDFCVSESPCDQWSAPTGWHFYAFAWEPSTRTLTSYLDGATGHSVRLSTAPVAGAVPVTFGSPTAPFQGMIFNPAVYPRYLVGDSVSELKSLTRS